MICPYCNRKVKVNFKLLVLDRCEYCNNRISKCDKKIEILSGVNVLISLILFVIISNVRCFNSMDRVVSGAISFVIGLLILAILQIILLKCHNKLFK